MASDLNGWLKFSDGSTGYFVKEGASVRVTNELVTGGQGLNQVSGVSAGQAYEGKTVIAGGMQAVEDGTQTLVTGDAGGFAYILDPQGKIARLIQVGGASSTGFAPMRPIRLSTGMTFQGFFEASTDGLCMGFAAVECTDGTSDCFSAVAVDNTKTAMVNKDGNTIGQALTGKIISRVYGNYNSTKSLNEDGIGVSAFYLESSDGQLKHLIPPSTGNGDTLTPYIPGYRTRILQNDTLSIMGTT